MQRFQWVLTVLAALFFTPLAVAEGDAILPAVVAPGAVGVVTNVEGSLTAAKTGVAPRTLAVYDNVAEGEVLSTAAGAYARVKFADGGELILRPDSQAEITRYAFVAATPASDSAIITLIKGGLRSLSGLMGKRNPEHVSFKTKTATIGIRGTDFGLLECKNNCGDVMPPGTPPPPNGTHVDVTQGSVAVSTPSGQLVINAGQFAYVKSPTARPQRVPPTKGVKVTVPPTIRKDPPPKPQAAASTNKSKTQAKSDQTQPAVAATTATASAATTSGISSDLSAAISQLPATPALSSLQTDAQSQSAVAESVDTSISTSASNGSPGAASTAAASPTSSAFDSSAQAPAVQAPPSAMGPASTWTSTASIGNSADLSSAISQLPATAVGPIAAPTLPTAAPNISATFGASPASSLGGGGGRAVSRN